MKKIDSNLFKKLTKLELLQLNSNELTDIDAKAFESLSNLKTLWLNNNKLTKINKKWFVPLKSIQQINLYFESDISPIKCNKYSFNGANSDWNAFLQQFPEIGSLFIHFLKKLLS